MATNKRKVSDIYTNEDQDTSSKKVLHDDVPNIADYKLPYPSTTLRSHDTQPVAFQQPTPLVTFSYNSSHVLQFNDSALRYYVDPPAGADLKYGYDRWIRRPEEKARIDGLLKAWMKAKESLPDGGLKGGVIAWRGVMTK
jgi:RAT1-interacting protein